LDQPLMAHSNCCTVDMGSLTRDTVKFTTALKLNSDGVDQGLVYTKRDLMKVARRRSTKLPRISPYRTAQFHVCM
jgi:hypothetical protein